MRIARPSGVLCAGNIVLDILARPVERIEWNTTAWVESIEQHLGGNGANSVYTLARLGVPVRLLAAAGDDAFGEDALGQLRAAGVDVSAVARTKSPTAVTVGLVNSQGDRFFLHRGGASMEAFAAPVDFAEHGGGVFSHFHLANAFALPHLRKQAAEVLRSARAAGMSTSVDTGWDSRGRWAKDLAACFPLTDLLFVNEDEALRLSGQPSFQPAARRLLEMGARAVVVKLGGRGSAVYVADEETQAPAFEVTAVDTTGAGDCFVGAFLAALHHGRSYQEAARFANAAAGLAVQQLGATGGLRSFAETEAWMAAARTREPAAGD